MASPTDGERDTLLRSVQTYVAGEDAGRMASAARALGLSDGGRKLRRRVVRSLAPSFWNDTTLTAARMHSVGALGPNERIDRSGTLTIRSRRRRTRDLAGQSPSYGSLRNLFHAPTADEGLDHRQEGEVKELSSDEELDEDDSPEMVAGGSLSAAVFGIVKGTVGPAILYLPHGLQTSGYGVAVPSMLLATGLYLYASHCLLSCWRVEHERQHQIAERLRDMQKLLLDPRSDTGDTTDDNKLSNYTPKLLTYPEIARRALPKYSILVDMGIASMQYGVCLTYMIFVPANLVACTQGKLLSKTGFLILMTLLEIPLSWISDIRKLTITNVMATLLILYGLTSVVLMAVWEGMKRIDQDEATWVWLANAQTLPPFTETWFLFVGTSFFMMEGSITLLVPLQEAVFLPQDRQRFPRVNQQVTSSIVVVYIVFALVCVLGLSRPGGGHLPTALTAALPETALGWWTPSIQAAYAVAVLLTFPLQAFPATQVTSRLLFGPDDTNKAPVGDGNDDDDDVDATTAKPWFGRQQVLSTTVTIALGLIAYVAIDYLGNVVSILGSLFGIPLALVFPPLMHNSLVLDSKSGRQNAAVSDMTKARNVTVARITNYIVVCMGLCAMMAASMATIVSWDEGAEK